MRWINVLCSGICIGFQVKLITRNNRVSRAPPQSQIAKIRGVTGLMEILCVQFDVIINVLLTPSTICENKCIDNLAI